MRMTGDTASHDAAELRPSIVPCECFLHLTSPPDAERCGLLVGDQSEEPPGGPVVRVPH